MGSKALLSSFRVSLPLPCALFWAVFLWPAAFVAMVSSTVYHDAHLGRWAILIGLAAATCSGQVIVSRARRVVLDVVSWEHRRTRDYGVSAEVVRIPTPR